MYVCFPVCHSSPTLDCDPSRLSCRSFPYSSPCMYTSVYTPAYYQDALTRRTRRSSSRNNGSTRWIVQCSQQEYWTEEREGQERQKLADLKAELAQIKEKMQTYGLG